MIAPNPAFLLPNAITQLEGCAPSWKKKQKKFSQESYGVESGGPTNEAAIRDRAVFPETTFTRPVSPRVGAMDSSSAALIIDLATPRTGSALTNQPPSFSTNLFLAPRSSKPGLPKGVVVRPYDAMS